jgi:hypothetical protein
MNTRSLNKQTWCIHSLATIISFSNSKNNCQSIGKNLEPTAKKNKNQEIKQLEKSHYAVIPSNCCGTQGSSGLGTSKTIVLDDNYSLDIWVIHPNWKPHTSKRARSQMTRRYGLCFQI